jgi:hypothetical protein
MIETKSRLCTATFVVSLCIAGVTASVRADAISLPPPCPPGQRMIASHDFFGCVPEALACTAGQTLRRRNRVAYCEPAPPPGGCPSGSVWASQSAQEAYCLGVPCRNSRDPACQTTSLCARTVRRRTRVEEIVTVACEPGSTCADTRTRCVTALRRVGEPPHTPARKASSPEPLASPYAVSNAPQTLHTRWLVGVVSLGLSLLLGAFIGRLRR